MDCKCCTLLECSPECPSFKKKEDLNKLLLRYFQNKIFWEALGEIPESDQDLCNLFEKLLQKEGLEPISVA